MDSGATKHYFKTEHKKYLQYLRPLQSGPTAVLPNNTTVMASHQGQYNLHPNLSSEAQKILVFPKVSNESLISVGQSCDDGCKITFDKQKSSKVSYIPLWNFLNRPECERDAPRHDYFLATIGGVFVKDVFYLKSLGISPLAPS